MMTNYIKAIEPDYVKNLPDDAKLTTKEMFTLLGYKSKSPLLRLISLGELPGPTITKCHRIIHNFWCVGTLRKTIFKD